MTPIKQRLYQLWYKPGSIMEKGWWNVIQFANWRDVYFESSLSRPILDTLLCRHLGHNGLPPPISALAEELLGDDSRRQILILALGLWEIGGAESLLIKPYRDALSQYLTSRHLSQLQVLLPFRGEAPSFAADILPQKASELGYAWLAQSSDKALRTCRLLYPPTTVTVPDLPFMHVLQKLARWI